MNGIFWALWGMWSYFSISYYTVHSTVFISCNFHFLHLLWAFLFLFHTVYFFCVLFPYGLEIYGKIIHYYFSIMFYRIISPFCNWDKACGRYFQRRKITYQCNLDHSFLSKSCFIFLSSFWNCLVSITSLSIICVKGCRLDISLCRFPSAFRTLG